MVAQTWHPDAKHYGYGFHYNPELDKFDLTTDAPADVMAPLLQRFPDTLTYRTGRVGRATRQNDPAPHRGGAVLVNSAGGEWCTSGFTVVSTNGSRYMVTAGHCYIFLQQVYGWSGQYFGSIRNRASFPLWDVEVIGRDASGGGSFGSVIYVGNVYGVTILVGGAGSVAVGSTFCISGTVVGETCSNQVVSTNGTLCDNGECTGGLIKMFHQPSGVHDTYDGDSGAPVYNYFGSPSKVAIRGMFIGYGELPNEPSYNYAEHWLGIANLYNVTIATT